MRHGPTGLDEERGQFARALGVAKDAERVQRVNAARTVTNNALDAEDRESLLAMLGLEAGAVEGDDKAKPDRTRWPEADADVTPAVTRGLAGYLSAVATAVGVPVEGTSYEVSDTATAYLALIRRLPDRPDHDLMLVWSERVGWAISVETQPTEPPVVLALLGGDLVPEPQAVVRFVTAVLAGDRGNGSAVGRYNRPFLAELLSPYAAAFAS